MPVAEGRSRHSNRAGSQIAEGAPRSLLRKGPRLERSIQARCLAIHHLRCADASERASGASRHGAIVATNSGMRLYLVYFSSRGFLERAFARLIDADNVASCSVELKRGCLRFLAPPRGASHLVERFYLEGGMTWCTAHNVVPEDGAAIGLAPGRK